MSDCDDMPALLEENPILSAALQQPLNSSKNSYAPGSSSSTIKTNNMTYNNSSGVSLCNGSSNNIKEANYSDDDDDDDEEESSGNEEEWNVMEEDCQEQCLCLFCSQVSPLFQTVLYNLFNIEV